MFVIREITPCQHLAPLSFVRTVLDCCAAGNGAKRSCAFWMAALRSSPQRDLRNKDLPFRIKRVQNSQEKVGRIQACEPRIKAIRFPRAYRSMFPEAMRQLLQFPRARHDDFPTVWRAVCR